MTGGGGGFEAWLREEQRGLFRLALALMGNYHDAEDLLHEALTRVWRYWGTVNDPGAYARRVMVTYATQLWRRRDRLPTGTLGPEHDVAADGPDVDLMVSVFAAMQQLSPKQRAVLALRFWEDLTQSSTAHVLGWGLSRVKGTEYRALAKLQELLGSDATAQTVRQAKGHIETSVGTRRREA